MPSTPETGDEHLVVLIDEIQASVPAKRILDIETSAIPVGVLCQKPKLQNKTHPLSYIPFLAKFSGFFHSLSGTNCVHAFLVRQSPSHAGLGTKAAIFLPFLINCTPRPPTDTIGLVVLRSIKRHSTL